ncbi:MAG: DUF177 domain-containing protein [Acidimicrobiales bacterium]
MNGSASLGGGERTWPPRPSRLPVNVADLRRRLGQRRDVEIDIIPDPLTVVATRTVERPVVGVVTVESIERGVSVTGAVSFDWEGDCRRCLGLTCGSVEVEIDEIFQVGAPDDSDLIDFDGDQIDLVPVVRDAVALSLPLAPLCREECAGPDPERYPARAAADEVDDDSDDEERIDPRWSALAELDLGQVDDN